MLRGHAHATFNALNLYDPLVQLQTKIVAFFIRDAGCDDLPALSPLSHNELDNEELITHVTRLSDGPRGLNSGACKCS
jgi:hypothetical protein